MTCENDIVSWYHCKNRRWEHCAMTFGIVCGIACAIVCEINCEVVCALDWSSSVDGKNTASKWRNAKRCDKVMRISIFSWNFFPPYFGVIPTSWSINFPQQTVRAYTRRRDVTLHCLSEEQSGNLAWVWQVDFQRIVCACLKCWIFWSLQSE